MNQKGRSMVEMLGVLAIIGVLSAGGLAGYSKAMFKHRMNETINTFSQVLQRFAELDEKDFSGLENDITGSEDFVKYGLLPDCQATQRGCKLPSAELEMRFSRSLYSSQGLVGGFDIYFTSSKECVAFMSAGWEKSVPVDWWYPNGYIQVGSKIPLYHPSGSVWSAVSEVTMSDIVEGCQVCDENLERCFMYMAIHEDY